MLLSSTVGNENEVGVAFNGIKVIPKYVKISQLVQRLKGRHTYKHTAQ
jgi:hypothetical protein